jgi:hypothetical protein
VEGCLVVGVERSGDINDDGGGFIFLRLIVFVIVVLILKRTGRSFLAPTGRRTSRSVR